MGRIEGEGDAEGDGGGGGGDEDIAGGKFGEGLADAGGEDGPAFAGEVVAAFDPGADDGDIGGGPAAVDGGGGVGGGEFEGGEVFGEGGIVGGELGGDAVIDSGEGELIPEGEDGGDGEGGGGGVEEGGGLLLAVEGAGDEDVARKVLGGEIFAETGGLLLAEGGEDVVGVPGAGLAVAEEGEGAHKREWAAWTREATR